MGVLASASQYSAENLVTKNDLTTVKLKLQREIAHLRYDTLKFSI